MTEKKGCITDKTYSENLKNREPKKINKHKITFGWETISEKDFMETYRSKVIGGWIILNCSLEQTHIAESMVFVPDPEHLWKVYR